MNLFVAAGALHTEWQSAEVIALKLLGVLVLVSLNGFFVAAEFALVKIRSSQLDPLIEERNKKAKLAKRITEHLDAYLSACQLGITLASLALGWIGEPFVKELLDPIFVKLGVKSAWVASSVSFAVAFSIITSLHITLGEQA